MRLIAALFLLWPVLGNAQRVDVSLDGSWQIEDSMEAGAIPSAWNHTVPVPGLANLAQPGFVDVDKFDSMEVLSNRARKTPGSPVVKDQAGIPHQPRNWFWYAKTFRVPARKQMAVLRIRKAQFSTAVWLNGKKIGEHAGSFTAGYFDLTPAMDWNGENRLIVRVGAHPAVLPVGYPTGSDFEKNKWTPGIYDSVSVLLMDNPAIESVQVAPRIQSSEILVETRLKNHGSAPASFQLRQEVTTWKGGQRVAQAAQAVKLAPGEEKAVRQIIAIPGAQLWSPEKPFLYVLETRTGGDSEKNRFAMREFRFDTATRRAYLNGQVYFLRGSNVTLHRFFEDPDAGNLTWDEGWVRKLLVDMPKRMNWNSFRFCIGPVPDKWLDIADEAGLLIQNEFFIWTGDKWGDYDRHWDAEELIREYKEWMRDNWNHASVAIWDANNESRDPVFGEKVIPAVRGLDLSNRPWENSYNMPAGPDDPVEDHPYLFQAVQYSHDAFKPTQLEGMAGQPNNTLTPTAHALILNEYGWLWLLRDGSPTLLTDKVYESLVGPNATGQQRLETYAYYLGGLTEFWRAHRNHAAVLHFTSLTSCYQGAYTCDNLSDVKTLTLEPHFADYVREAFKPLGVYMNFWQPEVAAGSERRIDVMMINDAREQSAGKLTLSLEGADGKTVASQEVPFTLVGLGQQTYTVNFRVPQVQGDFLLKAAALASGSSEPTLSRRKVKVR